MLVAGWERATHRRVTNEHRRPWYRCRSNRGCIKGRAALRQAVGKGWPPSPPHRIASPGDGEMLRLSGRRASARWPRSRRSPPHRIASPGDGEAALRRATSRWPRSPPHRIASPGDGEMLRQGVGQGRAALRRAIGKHSRRCLKGRAALRQAGGKGWAALRRATSKHGRRCIKSRAALRQAVGKGWAALRRATSKHSRRSIKSRAAHRQAIGKGWAALRRATSKHRRAASTIPKHAHRLVDLALELHVRLQEDEQLAVVHFEHHACDPARLLGLELSDGQEELFAEHPLVGPRGRRGQSRSSQRSAWARLKLSCCRRRPWRRGALRR